MAEHMVQTAYNAQHKVPWHWPVPAYVVTTHVGAGVGMVLALAAMLGLPRVDSEYIGDPLLVLGLLAALLFTGITTGLLVFDLEKPGRFLTILTRPQWKSWLTRGAFLLIGFSLVVGLWFLLELGAATVGINDTVLTPARTLLAWLTFPLALGAAVYTAFLFAQAEGRDLWQSPLMPFHMAVQTLLAGSGALLALGLFILVDPGMVNLLTLIFVGGLLIDLFVILVGEFAIPHASEIAARAAHDISRGRYRYWFWVGAILLGHILPLALLALAGIVGGIPMAGAVAGVAAILGLYAFEHAFIMAPQEIPNS
jgi:formate-dependent nitrite reductase membrane component NrfD